MIDVKKMRKNEVDSMIDQDKMRALAKCLRADADFDGERESGSFDLRYEAADAIDLLLAEVEAAAADKQKMAGLLKRIPQTPQQAIDFIGSQYSSMEADGWEADLSTPSGDLSNVRYVLTVHDLLSAFSWNGLDDAEALSQRQEES
jgi:hypothetical protein